MEPKQMALEITNVLDDKKGMDIMLLDLDGKSSLADYFIIATGSSQRHVSSLIGYVEDAMGDKGIMASHKEGHNAANWVILDYADVVVHVLDDETRNFYNLERIWSDAKKVELHIDTL